MTPDQLSALSNTAPPNTLLPGSLPNSPVPGLPAAVANSDNQLKALADIHLPDQISWWPPAPGWWIVFFITLLLIYLAYKIIKKKLHQAKYKKRAKYELQTISRFWKKQQNLIATSSRLSILVRRIALADISLDNSKQNNIFPANNALHNNRRQIASLSDQQWLLYLEQQPGLAQCSKLYREILLQLPYQDPMIHFDISEQQQLSKKMDDLLASINIWINKGFKHV